MKAQRLLFSRGATWRALPIFALAVASILLILATNANADGCNNCPQQFVWSCEQQGGTVDVNCSCIGGISPIVIDVAGSGVRLTSAPAGVIFDIRADGHPIQIAWINGTGAAFLGLDRNHNGMIDSGAELFGNFTPQPPAPRRNGFLALAEFDKSENGGNADGIIDVGDTIFSSLRLWVDQSQRHLRAGGVIHTAGARRQLAFSCLQNGGTA